MFAKKKIFLSADSVKEVANSIEKYGFEVTSANYILTALKGNIVKVHSEGEFSKATIILNLHFQSGKREIDVPEINICLSKIQETPLTTRWSPGHYASPEIEKTIESDEDFIQVAKGISESFPQWASPVITIRPRVPLRSIIVLGANITEKNVFQEKMIGWVVKFAEDIEEASQVIEKFAKYHAYFSVIFSFLDSEKAFKFLQSIRSIEKSTHYKTFICGLHNPTRPKLYDSISNF